MKKFLALLFCSLLVFLSSCNIYEEEIYKEVEGGLEIHYIDVGQADSSLIICNDETMLIDGGNVSDSRLLVSYIKNLGITKLDYVVCTHAHEDHVGGLSGPLNVFEIGTVYGPKVENDIKTYDDFKKSALKKVEEIKHPEVGEMITLGESEITFLAPVTDYEDLNDTSIALRLLFGETSFLFTGDATYNAEYDIIDTELILKSDVYKVAHHGSSSSNSYRFLREVMPKYAIISCGEDNSYGHPHKETLSRLNDLESEVYRTDLSGNIVLKSDGKNITVETLKNAKIEDEIDKYIGNKNSMKFHLQSCNALPIEKNRIYFESKSEAISMGYSSCGNCRP